MLDEKIAALWELHRPAVMGIVNVTEDSFADGGRFAERADAVRHGVRLATQGASVVDVGGESTRPGAEPVSVANETERVVPVIAALARELPGTLISVDTAKAAVAAAALDAGARLVNDVAAGRDPAMLPLVAARGAAVVLMHMRGDPSTMQSETGYADVVAEVHAFLRDRAAAARAAGIPAHRVFLDPGIGFGKDLDGNLALLRALPDLAALGHPIVVGASRKSFIGRLTGAAVDDRLPGSLAALAATARLPRVVVRVHDVADTVQFLTVAAALEGDGMTSIVAALRALTQLEVSARDLVDVALVAILFYLLLVVIKGTRGTSMLWGILVLTATYLAATALDLITLSTVLREMLFYLPFAIIVVFQHEIRRILAAVGRTPLLRWASQLSPRQVLINDIVLACETLVARRYGALMVIERDEGLRAFVETGLPLDARLSYDLLVNLFTPGTPLHDGAAVVQGNRIAAASCFLPLSTRPDLSTEYGSRHRAALGISEETDAVVVVVSEERGAMSVAEGGRLHPNLDRTSLRDLLLELLLLGRTGRRP